MLRRRRAARRPADRGASAASTAAASPGSAAARARAARLSLAASPGSSSTASTAAASAATSPGGTRTAAFSPVRPGDAAGAGGDQRAPRAQRLLHDQRLPLPAGGHHDHIGGGEQGGHVPALAEEAHPEPARIRLGPQPLVQRPGAREDEYRAGVTALPAGRGRQQRAEALLGASLPAASTTGWPPPPRSAPAPPPPPRGPAGLAGGRARWPGRPRPRPGAASAPPGHQTHRSPRPPGGRRSARAPRTRHRPSPPPAGRCAR